MATGFLDHLLERTFTSRPTIRPRLASRFEPAAQPVLMQDPDRRVERRDAISSTVSAASGPSPRINSIAQILDESGRDRGATSVPAGGMTEGTEPAGASLRLADAAASEPAPVAKPEGGHAVPVQDVTAESPVHRDKARRASRSQPNPDEVTPRPVPPTTQRAEGEDHPMEVASLRQHALRDGAGESAEAASQDVQTTEKGDSPRIVEVVEGPSIVVAVPRVHETAPAGPAARKSGQAEPENNSERHGMPESKDFANAVVDRSHRLIPELHRRRGDPVNGALSPAHVSVTRSGDPRQAKPSVAAEAATIHVTIGRVEVKASSAPPAPVRTTQPSKPSLPLDAYLRRRQGVTS